MFTAIAAGVPISEAISQASIDAVVQKAQQAAQAINAIMSDPSFKAAIGSIQTAISGIAKASSSTVLARQRSSELARQASAAAAEKARQAAEDAAEKARRESEAAAEKAADKARQRIEEQKRAAEELRQAWQQLTDSLSDEIRRIRGELVNEDGRGMGYLQSQFAIATAQARSGNQDAAKMLPELSRAILDMAQTNAATLADLQRLQGQTASSLVETRAVLAKKYNLDIPQFAVGTNYVPNDMLAMVHEGEAIVPKAYNPAANGSDELMKVLISEVTNLRAEVRAGVTHSAKTAKILERVTPDGNSLAVSDAT